MKRDAFFALCDRLSRELCGNEVLYCNLDGEDSDFARLSRNRIRQAGSVRSRELSLDLVDGKRQVRGICSLSGDTASDLEQARHLIARLRERLPHVPEDPFLNWSNEPTRSDSRTTEELPQGTEAVAELIEAAKGLDLVGIWASGEVMSGLASSLGHRRWHESASFNLDFSCYLTGDKAVKACLSGLRWDPAALTEKLEILRRDLNIMARPPRTIEPGRYRAYLAPAATAELLDMLAWGGFGLKDHRTSQTPLLRLVRGERNLDSRVTLREEHDRGLIPRFTPEGFTKPEGVPLIEDGRYSECLVEARSGKEYGVAVNAAGEYPESLAMAPGDIPVRDVLKRLGTGLYISNLWYLNYADRNDCRITGMTRFASYWVENGEPVAPVNVMRFDDSLYHLLGGRLEGLTKERELMVSPETYEGRSTASTLLPGLLLSEINLAL
jgi:predicted Zn-dependent protease